MKKEVQLYILKVLELLKINLKSEQKHNFSLGEDGRLWLWIRIEVADVWQSIIFDEKYEDISPEKLVEDIIVDLKNNGYKI